MCVNIDIDIEDYSRRISVASMQASVDHFVCFTEY